MLQIKIPKPCHQSWNEMTPTSKGAFCSACSKEVVDFTNMSDAEVQSYFVNKSSDKVCGKFTNGQIARIRIHISPNIFYSKIAGWKKFMAIVLLAFGSMLFGCDVTQDEVVGKPINMEQKHQIELTGDTVVINANTTGTILGTPPVIDTILESNCSWSESSIKGDISIEPPSQTMGEPALVQPPTVQEPLKDSIANGKIKLPTDTTNCGEQHFY